MTGEERKDIIKHRGKAIYDFIIPQLSSEPLMFGSTDVGDVSMSCPDVQLHAATYAAGTALHSWQAVAQGKEPLMHKGELYAAKVMAGTGNPFDGGHYCPFLLRSSNVPLPGKSWPGQRWTSGSTVLRCSV